MGSPVFFAEPPTIVPRLRKYDGPAKTVDSPKCTAWSAIFFRTLLSKSGAMLLAEATKMHWERGLNEFD